MRAGAAGITHIAMAPSGEHAAVYLAFEQPVVVSMQDGG